VHCAITTHRRNVAVNELLKHMTRAITFTQAQVRRAVKAAESAGLRVCSVTVNRDGSITINSGEKPAKAVDTKEKALAASWDDF
jgi:hypothetical protein